MTDDSQAQAADHSTVVPDPTPAPTPTRVQPVVTPVDQPASYGRLGPLVEHDRQPLQRVGRDRLVETVVVGGPRAGRDTRLMLDVDTLERLLVLAKRSPSRRVVFNRVGIKIRLWQHRDSHRYETWSLVSDTAEPEPLPQSVRTLLGRST